MNLIEAFEQNLTEGIDMSAPDKTIETIISKIFFYNETVYKIYKYKKFFFGDFASSEFRKNFYGEDFYWNNKMAPNVYLALRGVKKSGKKYKFTELADAEDFFIKMKKFDDNKNLTNLLLNGEVSGSELARVAEEMILRLRDLTKSRKSRYTAYFHRDLMDIHFEDLEGDRNLMYMISDFVLKSKVDKIIDAVKAASAKDDYYKRFNSNNLSVLIDNHADNIVFLNNQIEFIDVLPPKESWRVGDLNFAVCRLATDAAVLDSPNLAEAVYNNCAPIPDKIKAIYETRSALIQTWCFYSVNKPDIAKKYLCFAEEKAALFGRGYFQPDLRS